MIHLLDGNVLVALAIDSHIHHEAAHAWLKTTKRQLATCVITQGTLLRVHMTVAADKTAKTAWQKLQHIVGLPEHHFWNDGFSFAEVGHQHLQGPGQITDAWLAALARRRRAKLATFDSTLATVHDDVVELIPIT